MNEAALRIHDIVNESMASASRVQAVERGHDPSGHSLVSFGGAGPVHAFGVARRLGLRTIIVPPSAGLGSAVGLLLAPRTFRLSRTFIGTLDQLEWARIETLFAEMIEEAVAALRASRRRGSRDDFPAHRRHALPGPAQGADHHAAGRQARAHQRDCAPAQSFEMRYKRVYHRIHDNHPIEALAWRLAAVGPPINRPSRTAAKAKRAQQAKPIRKRPMLFDALGRTSRLPGVFALRPARPATRCPDRQ